jgi:hypothetical protein
LRQPWFIAITLVQMNALSDTYALTVRDLLRVVDIPGFEGGD